MSAQNPNDVIVKIGMPADLFIWSRDTSDESGLSHAAFIRLLVSEERRRRALGRLSVTERYGDTDGSGPFRARDMSIYSDKV